MEFIEMKQQGKFVDYKKSWKIAADPKCNH